MSASRFRSALWRTTLTVVASASACAPIAGIDVKPCRPGCVDSETRLVCDGATAHAVKCPHSAEPCAEPSCNEGTCSYRPLVGASCGPDGLATCNEGYACLGPRTQLSAMRLHTCALADDGKVWCWGENPFSELGDGTSNDSGYPIPVLLPRPAIDVSAGYSHTCAVVDDGSVYCWGDNKDGKAVPSSSAFKIGDPVRVDTPDTANSLGSAAHVRFTHVSASENHTCALTDQSTVWCWGATVDGECGVDGATLGLESVLPTEVPGLDEIQSIDTGRAHTCAVRRGIPGLLCWGSNHVANDSGTIDGKLGPNADGLTHSATPLPVDFTLPNGERSRAPVVDIGLGYESTYAVVGDGVTYAWGSNPGGQLGTDSVESVVSVPSPVLAQDDDRKYSPLEVAAEALRTNSDGECLKLRDLSRDARYMCWGRDSYGSLGHGNPNETVRYPTATSVIPESASNLARGEQGGCFTAETEGVVQIQCFGRDEVVANGTIDRTHGQPLPAPVKWDPSRFKRFLER